MVDQAGADAQVRHPSLDELVDPPSIGSSQSGSADLKMSPCGHRSSIFPIFPLSTNSAYATELATTDDVNEGSVKAASGAMRIALQHPNRTEIVGHYVGGMAHDFNNLLTVVSGSLELLQARILQDRACDTGRHISTAQDAVQRAAAVARRLMSYARDDPDEVVSVDVNRFLAGMADVVRRAVGPNIVVLLDVADERWFVVVDPSQLESALLNLCLNARDAMPSGGRIVIQSTSQTFDRQSARDYGISPGRYISLRVSDDGCGLEEEVVSRAFEPFFSTKPGGTGNGFGLSMVKRFADLASGAVQMASCRGEGTDVTIHLPMSDSQVAG